MRLEALPKVIMVTIDETAVGALQVFKTHVAGDHEVIPSCSLVVAAFTLLFAIISPVGIVGAKNDLSTFLHRSSRCVCQLNCTNYKCCSGGVLQRMVFARVGGPLLRISSRGINHIIPCRRKKTKHLHECACLYTEVDMFYMGMISFHL